MAPVSVSNHPPSRAPPPPIPRGPFPNQIHQADDSSKGNLDNDHGIIVVESLSALPERSMPALTCMVPVMQSRFLLFGSASNPEGLYYYASGSGGKYHREQLLSGKVMDFALIHETASTAQLAILRDQHRISLINIQSMDNYTLILDEYEQELHQVDRNEPSVKRILAISHQSLLLVSNYQVSQLDWEECDGSLDLNVCVHTIHRVNDQIQLAAPSPHDTNLVVIATASSLEIIDPRLPQSENPVWECTFSTKWSVSDLKWSPTVPFWLAVAYDHGLAVFDLRQSPQTARLVSDSCAMHIHCYQPSAVCWSNSNAELLVMAHEDRTLSVISLLQHINQSTKKCRHVQKLGNFGGNLTRLAIHSGKLNCFFGSSISGRLVTVTLHRSLLEEMIPYQHTGDLEMSIERALYLRQMDLAYDLLMDYSNQVISSVGRVMSHDSSAAISTLYELTNRTTSNTLPLIKDWSLGSQANCSLLTSELQQLAISMPTGRSLQMSHGAMDAVNKVKLRVQLSQALEMNQSNSGENQLLQLLPQILDVLEEQPQFVPLDTIVTMIQNISSLDRHLALTTALRLLKMSSLFSNLSGIKAMQAITVAVLSPTIMEDDLSLAAAALHDVDSALGMIQLEIAALHASKQQRQAILIPSLDGSLTASLASSRYFSISALLAGEQLQILIAKSELHAYFHHLGRLLDLCGATSNSSSSKMSQRSNNEEASSFKMLALKQLEQDVMPAIKCSISQALETQRPTLVIRAIYLLAAIADGIRPLPDGMEPFVLDRLRRLARILPTESCAGSKGFMALAEYIHSIPVDQRAHGSNASIWREIESLRLLLSLH